MTFYPYQREAIRCIGKMFSEMGAARTSPLVAADFGEVEERELARSMAIVNDCRPPLIFVDDPVIDIAVRNRIAQVESDYLTVLHELGTGKTRMIMADMKCWQAAHPAIVTHPKSPAEVDAMLDRMRSRL